MVFIFFLSPTISSSENKTVDPRQQPDAPFAVVELFTSEGCSSSPPADQFLMDLTKLAEDQQKRIFTLSFHVDYWNDLGWEDPFSQEQFSQRQRKYAQKLGSTTVYTPQMIVNGTHAFGGYHRELAKEHIDEALQTPPSTSVKLEVIKHDDQFIELQYELSDITENLILHTALTERGIVSDVPNGENAGRTLRHDNVVRIFDSMSLTEKKGTIKIAKPSAVHGQQSSIIVYIQNRQDMKIVGANFIDLDQI